MTTDGFVKAKLKYETPNGMQELPCMFNPSELSYERKNKFDDEGAGDAAPAPPKEFVGEEPGSFDLELIFDTTTAGTSVTVETKKITDLMNIKDFSGDERPPMVQLLWGADIRTFKSFITSTKVSYIYFGADGTPLRARVSISLEQAFGELNEWGRQNPTSGTPEPHRRHQIQLGETLDRLSARYYGDATNWRVIADANGVTDPLALRPGRVVTIPKL